MIAVIGDSDAGRLDRRAQGLRLSSAGNLRNVGWKFGRWLDTPLMQRALGPHGATTPPIALSAQFATSDSGSIARSTRSSSWPRRTIRPVAEITLKAPWRRPSFGFFSMR